MSEFRWLLHGWPKVGKTTLASLFEKPIFCRTEQGTKALSVYAMDIGSWEDMAEAAVLLVKEKHDFQTVVIDVFERLFSFLYDRICRENEVDRIGDIGWAAGYDDANKRMWRLLDDLSKRVGVVLICHSRLIDHSVGGVAIKRTVPNLSDSPRNAMVGWPDVVLYVGSVISPVADKPKEGLDKTLEKMDVVPRVAYCQPYPDIEAGGRIRYLPGRIQLGTNPVEGYKVLEAEFNRAVQRQLAELGVSVPVAKKEG